MTQTAEIRPVAPTPMYERRLAELDIEIPAEATDVKDLPFVEEAFDLDDIVPFRQVSLDRRPLNINTGKPASLGDSQLIILGIRRAIGECIYARREQIALVDVHETEAAEHEEQAEDKGRPVKNEHHRKRLRAMSAQKRALADRCRFRIRQYELECIAQLNKLDRM